MVTDDRESIAEAMAPAFGIEPSEALHVPLALLGTIDEMVEELEWRRAEYQHLLLLGRGGLLGGPRPARLPAGRHLRAGGRPPSAATAPWREAG